MKDIAIYGAGGLGKEVACLILKINEERPIWNLLGFFDDGVEPKRHISHYGTVLGDIKSLNAWEIDIAVVMAVGNPVVAKAIVSKITNPKVSFPNIVYPGVRIADDEAFKMGFGNVIKYGCSFSCDIIMGDFNLFNGSVAIGHDVSIGSFNSFMPDVRISGEVAVGDENYFGVNSVVLQRVKIGNLVRVGALSVVMRNTKDGMLYIGNPARLTKL